MAEERVQRRLAAILAADGVGYSRLMHEDESGTLAQLKTLRKEVFDRRQLGTSCSARVHQIDLSAFLVQTVKTTSSSSAPILRQSHQVGRLASSFKPIAFSVPVLALLASSGYAPISSVDTGCPFRFQGRAHFAKSGPPLTSRPIARKWSPSPHTNFAPVHARRQREV